MINHLRLVENPLIKKFKHNDLQLLIDHNIYHSPEDSETDQESGHSNIVVKDLKWRSSTMSISFYLLCFFVVFNLNYF